jgi:hypothetical protein
VTDVEWFETAKQKPGIGGRLMICVDGSVREGYYEGGGGDFTNVHGHVVKPEYWASLPLAPSWYEQERINRLKLETLSLTVRYDPVVIDIEAVVAGLNTVLTNALATEGVLDELGEVHVSDLEVVEFNE